MVVLLVLAVAFCLAEESKSSEVTKLDVVDLGEVRDPSDLKISESQRKRDSGYVYNRPDRLSNRQRFNGPGYRGKILTRYPSQSQRPFNSYGVPLQSGQSARPSNQYGAPQNSNFGSSQNQFNGHRGQSNGHGNHQSQFSKPNGGYWNQEVPSPVRHVDFVVPSPIASQNDEPFGRDTANYLPPRNQELPTYSAPHTFVHGQQNFQQDNSHNENQNLVQQNQGQNFNFPDQNINQGISDGANFLAQNAQAISQLYGAPATDQNFAPNNEEFLGQNNQIQGVVGPSSGQGSQSQQGFQGPLPSYASGTLSSEESLAQIQSKEKDRLIAQLQTLLSQSQSQNGGSSEFSGQYAQNHGNYIQNQNLLASISSQFQNQAKYNGQDNLNVNQFGSANTAFGQAPFIPGTSTSPTFTLGYGLTTQQTPTTTTTTTTTTASPITPSQNPKGDGSSQSGTSVPAPAPGFPQYGGFVPSLVPGTSFVGGLPSYGPIGSGFVPATVQPAGSSPTHFGLPIPQDPNAAQQPQSPGSSIPRPVQTPNPVGQPSSSTPVSRPVGIPAQPVQPVHPIGSFHPVHPLQPVYPVQPVHAVHPVHAVRPLSPFPPAIAPLHPASSSVHGVQQFNPIPSPVQPVGVPATASAHPSYGIQSGIYNPLLYKPVKTVYPVLYYPNLQYQEQKPAVPTYPWSYAPSFAQAKPAQIWK